MEVPAQVESGNPFEFEALGVGLLLMNGSGFHMVVPGVSCQDPQGKGKKR